MTDDHTPKETVERTKDSPTQSDLLGDTLQGTQVLFSSIYTTLQRSLEQNQQMARSMTMMMQQVIRTKFRIDTRFDSNRLIITLLNATPYTIHIPSGKLILTPLIDFPSVLKSDEYATLELISSTYRTTGGDSQMGGLSLFLPERTATPQIVLSPNTDHQEVLCVKSSFPIPYHGLIDIQIPTLGHEVAEEDHHDGINSLHLTHSFGIYIIDQIEKVVVDKENEAKWAMDEEEGIERTYSGDFIRDTLTIPPMLGLYTGMRICLELASGSSFEEGGVIVCRIGSISTDSMQIRLFGKNKDVIQVLVHELDTLAG